MLRAKQLHLLWHLGLNQVRYFVWVETRAQGDGHAREEQGSQKSQGTPQSRHLHSCGLGRFWETDRANHSLTLPVLQRMMLIYNLEINIAKSKNGSVSWGCVIESDAVELEISDVQGVSVR